MSNAYIIVDDQDAQLNYTGQWSVGGSGVDYGQSLHASNTSSSSIFFGFSGTSVSLVGDYTAGGSCAVSVKVDGKEDQFNSPNITADAHQQTIWSSSGLQDQNHTLVYSVKSCSGNASTASYVWLDYLLYEPTPNSVASGSKYFIDDTSDRLEWNGASSPAEGDGDFNGTHHLVEKGTSLRLNFTGSLVSVYGRVEANTSTRAGFALDGGAGQVFNSPVASVVQHNVLLYSSGSLAPNQHSLVMTASSDDPVTIDYFIVRAYAVSDPMSGDASGDSSTHSAPSTALIAGVAAGAVVLIIALGAGFWFFRKKRKGAFRKPPQKPKSSPSLFSPSFPSTPGKDGVRSYADGDLNLIPTAQGYTYSSSRPASSQNHTRMRSIHKYTADGTGSDVDLARPHHLSVGGSSSASSNQYAESEVYAIYDDPFSVPAPTISSHHHASISSKTSLLRDGRHDSTTPSEFGANTPLVPRRKSRMQSVVTNRTHDEQSELAYDLPNSHAHDFSPPPSTSGQSRPGSHSASEMSGTSRKTPLHAMDSSEGYFPALADLKRRHMSSDMHAPTEYNDYFLPPSRPQSLDPDFSMPSVPNPTLSSSSQRSIPASPSASSSSRPLPEPGVHNGSESPYPLDVKRADGLVVMSVDGIHGLGQASSPRRPPVVHHDSGLRMQSMKPSVDLDIPDELPPVYTPR